MNTQLPLSDVLATLVRREYLEHRLMFVYLPLLFAVAAMAWFTIWLVQDSSAELLLRFPPDSPSTQTAPFPELPRSYLTGFYRNAFNSHYWLYEGLMLMSFWASMAYYYLYTLYQQRKDRSILFWNSFPVSDAQTIASKLLAGLVACHAVYMLCLVAVSLFMELAVSIYAQFAADGGNWQRSLAAIEPVANASMTIVNMPLAILWCLPVYGWLLLVSAWSPRAPFAWATGPWLVIIVGELAVSDRSWVLAKIAQHLVPATQLRLMSETNGHLTELVISVLLGMTFVYAAIRLNRSDDS